MPEEIFDLAKEKGNNFFRMFDFNRFILEKKKTVEGGWVEHKETSYNKLGEDYDKVISIVTQEKLENFMNYIR